MWEEKVEVGLLPQNTFKNAKKIKTKSYGDENRCSQLSFTNLAEFIYYSISGGLSLLYAFHNRFVLT